jgi:hypothetical protein
MDTLHDSENERTVVSKERKLIAKFLIRFAWAFEITAVAIGLAISISTMLSNFEEMQSYRDAGLKFNDWTNIFIAAIPFVMVAMVEITKIPLTGAFYHTSSRMWTWVFGGCLVFVTFMTFESAMNGFERNFSALMYSIDAPKKEMVTVNQSLEKLNEDRTRLTSLTLERIDSEYNERYEELFEQTNAQKLEIQEQINLLRASIQTEHVESLRRNLDAALTDKERLYGERSQELERLTIDYRSMAEGLTGEISAERRSKQAQLLRAQSRLDDMRKQAEKEIEDASIFTAGGVRERWESQLSAQEALVSEMRQELNAMGATQRVQGMRDQEQSAKDEVRDGFGRQIAEVNARIDRLSREISKSIGTKELEIQDNVDRYQEQMKAIDSQFQLHLLVIQKKRDKNYKRLENNAELVDDLDGEIDQYATRKIQLVKEINEKVGTNQIYRIATWWANKDSAAEVDRSTVFSVAIIWFGSLSMLIAVMGIFMALGSYVIGDKQRPDRKEKKKSASTALELSKLARALRRFIVYRKRRVATKFVEVDKVVFKEVPVEIVKKEFVHIPFYTNDERLLNMSANDLEETDGDPGEYRGVADA